MMPPGGTAGHYKNAPPRQQASPGCPSTYSDVGLSAGFLLGGQASLTFNGGNFYFNYGPMFTPIPGAGGSYVRGTVYPAAGQSVTDVLSGYSVTASAGYGYGAQFSGNGSGVAFGQGFMTPSLGGGIVWTAGPFPIPFMRHCQDSN
jgi:hypothetical protein